MQALGFEVADELAFVNWFGIGFGRVLTDFCQDQGVRVFVRVILGVLMLRIPGSRVPQGFVFESYT